jgi:hypothetical protein
MRGSRLVSVLLSTVLVSLTVVTSEGLPDSNVAPLRAEPAAAASEELPSQTTHPEEPPSEFEESVSRFRQAVLEVVPDGFVELELVAGTLTLTLSEGHSLQASRIDELRASTGLDEFAQDGDVSVSVIPFTREKLLNAHAEFDERMIRADINFSASYINWSSGELVVTFRPESRGLEGLSPRTSTGVPVRVDFRDAAFVAADSRNSWPPYKAGRRIGIDGGAPFCTAGLSVWISSGSQTGLKQGTTAGHCGQAINWTRTAWNGSNYTATIGTNNTNTFYSSNPSNADVQLIGPSNQNNVGRSLYVNSNLTRLITSRTQTGAITSGATTIYMSGVTSNIQGGTAVQYPVTIYYEDYARYVHNTLWWTGISAGGDSGAPVYRAVGSNEASGVGNNIAFCIGSGCIARSALQPIGIIESRTGTRLTCSPVGVQCPDLW